MKKKILALFLCFVLTLALVACGGNGETPVTDSNAGSSAGTSADASAGTSDTDTADKNSDKEEVVGFDNSMEHKIIVTDIDRHSIVVFDLNKCNGDYEKLTEDDVAVFWEWDSDDDPNCKIKPGLNLDSAKLRYSPYYEKDVMIACASNGWVGIVDYEAKSLIWEYKLQSGPHSVEMLPNGDLAVSVSNDPGALVYFPLSSGLEEPSHSVPSLYCHGVCWDPEEELLWVLEDTAVVAFRVSGMGTETAKLVRIGGMGAAPGGSGGHAFAPVGGQPGKYWAAFGTRLFVFDSERATLTGAPDNLTGRNIKGICSFADGTVVQVIAGLGDASYDWSGRDLRILVKEPTSSKVQPTKDVVYEIIFTDREFYKVQAFSKDYQ